jgi:hypothetical protein
MSSAEWKELQELKEQDRTAFWEYKKHAFGKLAEDFEKHKSQIWNTVKYDLASVAVGSAEDEAPIAHLDGEYDEETLTWTVSYCPELTGPRKYEDPKSGDESESEEEEEEVTFVFGPLDWRRDTFPKLAEYIDWYCDATAEEEGFSFIAEGLRRHTGLKVLPSRGGFAIHGELYDQNN